MSCFVCYTCYILNEANWFCFELARSHCCHISFCTVFFYSFRFVGRYARLTLGYIYIRLWMYWCLLPLTLSCIRHHISKTIYMAKKKINKKNTRICTEHEKGRGRGRETNEMDMNTFTSIVKCLLCFVALICSWCAEYRAFGFRSLSYNQMLSLNYRFVSLLLLLFLFFFYYFVLFFFLRTFVAHLCT